MFVFYKQIVTVDCGLCNAGMYNHGVVGCGRVKFLFERTSYILQK